MSVLPLLRQLFFCACLISLTGCYPSHYLKHHGDVVTLYLKAPDAKNIYFASSLDRFDLHEAKKGENGQWQITVPSYRSFEYFYLVDDSVLVPPCQIKVNDDFGSKNCLYEANL